MRNTISAPSPWSAPDTTASRPHCDPRTADTLAATSSVKRAAPGLRMMSPAGTAGTSQTPERMFWAGGIATNAGVAAAHTWFHAQKTTPKAIAIAAATTMSTVRQAQSVLLTSGTSRWCLEDEQRTSANPDFRGQRRDLVAQTA